MCHGWLGFGSNLEGYKGADNPTQLSCMTGVGERYRGPKPEKIWYIVKGKAPYGPAILCHVGTHLIFFPLGGRWAGRDNRDSQARQPPRSVCNGVRHVDGLWPRGVDNAELQPSCPPGAHRHRCELRREWGTEVALTQDWPTVRSLTSQVTFMKWQTHASGTRRHTPRWNVT